MKPINTGQFLHSCFRRQRGQAMAEYIVGLTLALFIMVYPYEGDKSVLTVMLDAISTAWGKFLANLSLPI